MLFRSDKELLEKYLSNGAQPSDRVIRLLQADGAKLPAWAKPHDRFKKPKGEAEEAIEQKDTAAAETATEAGEANEEKAQSVDAPETAATEEKVAEDQKEATEEVAKAAEKAEEKSE